MKDTSFNVDHVAELRRIEKARLRRGEPGLGPELSALIARLTSGGVSASDSQRPRKSKAKLPPRDPRIIQQAKRLWNKGWGTVMEDSYGFQRHHTFAGYLASIPDLPTFPETYEARFPHLVLVDRRVQVVEACQMLGVQFGGDNSTFVPYDPAKSVTALV
ncbi:hypothetical protein HY634_04640, partial [Candidatus Uhrbacteria bacterium]|nr:hypothetical protein [Candidatus Uhrbacteria bacterium]